jgi:hypothetical protein
MNMTIFTSFAAPCFFHPSIVVLHLVVPRVLVQTKHFLTTILRGAQFPARVIPVVSLFRWPGGHPTLLT